MQCMLFSDCETTACAAAGDTWVVVVVLIQLLSFRKPCIAVTMKQNAVAAQLVCTPCRCSRAQNLGMFLDKLCITQDRFGILNVADGEFQCERE
jgi:hypothetical protein